MRLRLLLLFAASVLNAQVTYKVRLTSNDGNRIVQLTSEQYAAGVLAGESSTFQSDEALKAMAVLARTYAARFQGRHVAVGYDFCATTHCQRVELNNIPARLTKAAAATAGELLWFDGKAAFAVYSRDCGGRSESVTSVWPEVEASYLSVHSDPYCARHGANVWSWSAAPGQIAEALRRSKLDCPANLQHVTIRSRTGSGRAQTLELQGETNVTISASTFRFAIGRELGWNTIRSDLFEIDNAQTIAFHGRGQGHGVGLCQTGADEMGLEGHTYREILSFYFPGTSVSRLATGFHWTELSGEDLTLFTEHPDSERNVLSLAEHARRHAEERLHVAAPPTIELFVYPDIDSFRNATGEPGWVAAHSVGLNIHLQPLATLNRTGQLPSVLDHEMLHVVMEAHAAPGLPVWFREGLAEYLSPERSPQAHSKTGDLDARIRQRQSRNAAGQAYGRAESRVADLVARYGETAVLGWIERGLPAEVKNSSNNSAATNNK